MESALRSRLIECLGIVSLALCLGAYLLSWSYGQEVSGEGTGKVRRQKSVKTRELQGKAVEGEERVIGPQDSLWRIFIQEKGLHQKNFGRYVALTGSLNPQLKDPNVLPSGTRVFIPTRPDELLGFQAPAGSPQPKTYQVKAGDHLYKIIREQLGTNEISVLEAAVGQVKRLNPGRKDWNHLRAGDILAFPSFEPSIQAGPQVLIEPARELVGLEYGRKLPVQGNIELLERVLNAFGSEMSLEGEEILQLQEGNLHIDRSSFPIVLNHKKQQKVILDVSGKMPVSLRTKLQGRGSSVPVVSLAPKASIHEAVDSLIAHFGFQPLPAYRPIIVQDQGVEVQLKGEWMVAAPEEGDGQQGIWIVNLTDSPGRTPDYLQEYVLLRGMNLKEVLLSGPAVRPSLLYGRTGAEPQIEAWPREKKTLIDIFLKSYPVSYTMDRRMVLSLREGIRMDINVDRFFEFGEKQFAVFFGPIGEEAKRVLEKEGMRAVELDLESLSTRDLISRLAASLGENALYQEHHFSAVEGPAKEKVILTVPGFFFSPRSLLLTDREIPKDLHRFFFDRGLRVVYF